MPRTSGKSSRIQRMGRPRIAPEAARRNRVVTMVTDDEAAKLQDLAVAEGKSISAYVHELLASFLKRQP